jgi:hypothetical protein
MLSLAIEACRAVAPVVPVEYRIALATAAALLNCDRMELWQREPGLRRSLESKPFKEIR